MKFRNYILIVFLFHSHFFYSQKSYSSIDTLLSKVFQAVNLRDSNLYASRINLTHYFISKKIKSKTDSINLMLEVTNDFKSLIEDFIDMTGNPETKIAFNDYQILSSQNASTLKDGLIRLHVGVLLNNQMIVKMRIVVAKKDNSYSLENPLVSMFLSE